ncbi:lasso peptide isopeptide bond-forming cyclase [Spirosoma terrae]|uniref:asparagine synthase (glutamine-hydrolyzing) n=1 Tax=Spirosoma terrae TaxID=1968276 RepID=A0A6L9L5X8_9BACT|nr:asparagine synthetase B family protein [Spirosoma terrae]NDU95854.1 asparagine synthase [Spirosoma terrae]
MSGIAGIIRFDGRPITSIDVETMASLLKHRGQPIITSLSNATLITFNGKQEVDEDHHKVAVADADLFEKTIANPFIEASLQDTFNSLHADFAAVVYDNQQQALTCVRDPMGVKPLYYTFSPGRFFAFASEIKVLLALNDVDCQPNYRKFREYLTWPTSYVHYSEETFYEGIYSVLPGHYLQATNQSLTVEPYWDIDLDRFAGLKTASNYHDTFQQLFSHAVNVRMSEKKIIGSHLSGGLDSSSVSSMAQHLLKQQQRPSVHTFNIDSGLASTDESQYVQAVVNKHQTLHQTVRPLTDVLGSVTEITQQFDRPEQFIIPSSFHVCVSQAAQQIGCDTILTGHDGDSVITAGFDYLNELIEQADWQTLKEADRQFVSHKGRTLSNMSPKWKQLSDDERYQKHILSLVIPSLKKTIKEKSIGEVLSTFQNQKKYLEISNASLVAYIKKWAQQKWIHRAWIDTVLSDDFKQKYTLSNQRSTYQLSQNITKAHHVSVSHIVNINNVICNEQLNHIGAYHGHQYSFPFFDKRIIELGVATPLKVRFDEGRGRGLIRHGLQSFLPSEVYTRLSKTNFVEYSHVTAQQLYEATQEILLKTNNPVWDMVDRKAFQKTTDFVFSEKMPTKKKMRYNWLLSRVIYSSIWFDLLATKKK